MEKNGQKRFIQSSSSLMTAHYGSKAFKLTHWGMKSLTGPLAPQHSILLHSAPLHSAPCRSAHGLIHEWESGNVLTRPHASICTDSTRSVAPSSSLLLSSSSLPLSLSSLLSSSIISSCRLLAAEKNPHDGWEKIFCIRFANDLVSEWAEHGRGNERTSGALRSEWVSKQDC